MIIVFILDGTLPSLALDAIRHTDESVYLTDA